MLSKLEPQRDEYGDWTHPELLELLGDREGLPLKEWSAWKKRHGIEVATVAMEYDLDMDDPVWIRHFEDGNLGSVGWNPEPPGPEWSMLSIHDTEDGPVVIWYREVSGGA